MASAHDVSKQVIRLSSIFTTDFCPWANKFVYWLKEPVGWFVLATAVCVIVGLYVSPIGWTIAAALTAIMAVGMVWPFIAVMASECELGPSVDAVHEQQECSMTLSVRNRLPLPVWGLAVEGYLDEVSDQLDEAQPVPTVALACVPPLCTSTYSLETRPELRGRYPLQTPLITCAFPFGIWTAKRRLESSRPLTVWPLVYQMIGRCPFVGSVIADEGDGQRGGRSGDFVGVRDFRRGDSAKHVNWGRVRSGRRADCYRTRWSTK